MTVAGIWGVMYALIEKVWWLAAFLVAGYAIVLWLHSMKRGSGV